MRLVIVDLPRLPTLGALNRGGVGGDVSSHPTVGVLARLRRPVVEVIHALNYTHLAAIATTESMFLKIVVSRCGVRVYGGPGRRPAPMQVFYLQGLTGSAGPGTW